MARSLWVKEKCEEKVRLAFRRRFPSQISLSEHVGYAQAGISNFLNGIPVDRRAFEDICEALELDWQEVAAGPEVFVSSCNEEPDQDIAQAAAQALRDADYEVFPPLRQPMRSKRRASSLKRCDYFLLLLSNTSAISETVIEEVKQAVEFRNSRSSEQRPTILVVSVNSVNEQLLTYDLNRYLQDAIQIKWEAPSDTASVIHSIIAFLGEGQLPVIPRDQTLTQIDNPSSAVPEIPKPADTKSSSSKNVIQPQERPLPVAGPEIPRGQVGLRSNLYVERKATPTAVSTIEAECYDAISQPGALIRIKAPRQMGKTSLMARVLHSAEEQGCRTIAISLQLASQKWFDSTDKFLEWFCAVISLQLGISNEVSNYWGFLDGNMSCKLYFEQHIFKQIEQPIVIGLDEIDRIFEYPDVCRDVLGLLRALHEESKRQESWQKFRMIVVYSTEAYVPLDLNQSPFNVGLPIELPEFTVQQVQWLAHQQQLDWHETEVQSLMDLVGGHPFLIRLVLYHVARKDISLSELIQTAASSSGILSDHLRRYELILSQYPELAIAMQKVIDATEPVDLPTIPMRKLQGVGLIKVKGDMASPRCDLYRQYFRTHQLGGNE